MLGTAITVGIIALKALALAALAVCTASLIAARRRRSRK
jgi:hypothetical protein